MLFRSFPAIDQMIAWVKHDHYWKTDVDLWSVTIMTDEGIKCMLTHDMDEAWKYAEKNKTNLIYFAHYSQEGGDA